jgi:hypothetical protein
MTSEEETQREPTDTAEPSTKDSAQDFRSSANRESRPSSDKSAKGDSTGSERTSGSGPSGSRGSSVGDPQQPKGKNTYDTDRTESDSRPSSDSMGANPTSPEQPRTMGGARPDAATGSNPGKSEWGGDDRGSTPAKPAPDQRNSGVNKDTAGKQHWNAPKETSVKKSEKSDQGSDGGGEPEGQ